MLSDTEIDAASTALAAFSITNTQHQATLAEILQQYTTLVDDYKRLKSDYEEERDARERYKQLARVQDRNPFVLVLIDGDGYVFENNLIINGAEGGQMAAHLLHGAVTRSLRTQGLENCRIMVRCYANLVGLSKALSRAKLAGPEKRSLAPFTANFNRTHELFDFVDAGELKENADSKIRAMFRQFVDNPQCRQIYFAGCHDVGYINELTPYLSHRERITLVKSHAFHPEFARLGMRIEDFPGVFRTSSLDASSTAYMPSAVTYTSSGPNPVQKQEVGSGVRSYSQLCIFFQKGTCKNGENCRFLHVRSSPNGLSPSTPDNHANSSAIRDWRSNNNVTGAPHAFPPAAPQQPQHDSVYAGNSNGNDPIQNQIDFATSLPLEDTVPPNEIPVNKDQQRLDTYSATPKKEDNAAFAARLAVQKLCNKHHITANCPRGNACEYDHNPITPGMLQILKIVTRTQPCPRRGACRYSRCMNGHICQKPDCKFRGGKAWCKFPPQVHMQDLRYAESLPAQMSTDGKDASPDDDESASVSGSGKSATVAPLIGERTSEEDSESENEQDDDDDDESGGMLGASLHTGDADSLD